MRRSFWCAHRHREVEVEFLMRGFPGFGAIVGVAACSAYDPPGAIDCRRRCADPAFRRQWEPVLPVYDPRG